MPFDAFPVIDTSTITPNEEEKEWEAPETIEIVPLGGFDGV